VLEVELSVAMRYPVLRTASAGRARLQRAAA